MGIKGPLSSKDAREMADMLLSEPFCPRAIPYVLKAVRDDYSGDRGFPPHNDFRFPFQVCDPRPVEAYELQLNGLLGSRVLSNTGHIVLDAEIERRVHLSLEHLLVARAKRLARNSAGWPHWKSYLQQALGSFEVPHVLRCGFYAAVRGYDFVAEGLKFDKNFSYETTLSLPLYNAKYSGDGVLNQQ